MSTKEMYPWESLQAVKVYLAASLEQQLLHISVRKQDAVVKADRIRDDQLRKTVTLGSFSQLVHAPTYAM